MYPLLVDIPVELIGRRNVQSPQVLCLPRRQRIRMHGCNVGVGEQRQHAQRLVRLHLPHKRANRFRIEDVAPHRRGHLKVRLDQSHHHTAVVGIHLQPAQHALSKPSTFSRMIFADAAFAGVV